MRKSSHPIQQTDWMGHPIKSWYYSCRGRISQQSGIINPDNPNAGFFWGTHPWWWEIVWATRQWDYSGRWNILTPEGTMLTNPVSTTIKASNTGMKEDYCRSQGNKAALQEAIPGGEIVLGRDYRPATILAATAKEAAERGAALAEKRNAWLRWLREKTGLPIGRARGLIKGGGAATAVITAFQAIGAAQDMYKLCMEN